VAKYLDKVIEEMNDYSSMGMPDGEGSMGMGTPQSMGVRGSRRGDKKLKAYKLNDLLDPRNRNRAEEEEDGMDMDAEMGDMDNGHTEELKSFFMDNPSPSDEEVAMKAEEMGLDLEGMRKAVYALIQSLLPSDEEDMDNDMNVDMDMDMDDEGMGADMGKMSSRRGM